MTSGRPTHTGVIFIREPLTDRELAQLPTVALIITADQITPPGDDTDRESILSALTQISAALPGHVYTGYLEGRYDTEQWRIYLRPDGAHLIHPHQIYPDSRIPPVDITDLRNRTADIPDAVQKLAVLARTVTEHYPETLPGLLTAIAALRGRGTVLEAADLIAHADAQNAASALCALVTPAPPALDPVWPPRPLDRWRDSALDLWRATGAGRLYRERDMTVAQAQDPVPVLREHGLLKLVERAGRRVPLTPRTVIHHVQVGNSLPPSLRQLRSVPPETGTVSSDSPDTHVTPETDRP